MADNKDLKKFRGGIRLESTSAPANAETGALYFDSVAKGLKVHDGDQFNDVGSGSSGGLDTFYVEDFRATSAYSATGGTCSIIDDGDSLSEKSLKYIPSGTSAESFFCGASDITFYKRQKGKTCSISFYYTYDGADDDFTVQVKDNAGTILTSSSDLLKSTSTAKKFVTTFTIPSGATSLQWGIKKTTDADNLAAYKLIIDDVEISQDPFVQADLGTITDWKVIEANVTTYFPGLNGGTPPSGMNYTYRRVGDSLEVNIHLDTVGQSGGTNSNPGMNAGHANTAAVLLPDGLEVDFTKAFSMKNIVGKFVYGKPSGSDDLAGHGIDASSTLQEYTITVRSGWYDLGVSGGAYGDSKNYLILSDKTGSGSSEQNMSEWGAIVGSSSGNSLKIQATIPIKGWGSTNTHIVTPAKSNLTDWTYYEYETSWDSTDSSNMDKKDAYWRRVGDEMEIRFSMDFKGTISNTNPLEFKMPKKANGNYYKVDASKLPDNWGNTLPYDTGSVSYRDNANSATFGDHYFSGCTGIETVSGDTNSDLIRIRMFATDAGQGGNVGTHVTALRNGSAQANYFGTGSSHVVTDNEHLTASCRIPIEGWGLSGNDHFLAALPMTKWQKKQITSNLTSDGFLTEMQFSNLDKNKSYKLTAHAFLGASGSSTGLHVDAYNGGTDAGDKLQTALLIYENPSSDAQNELVSMTVIFSPKSDGDSTLKFYGTLGSVSDFVGGSGRTFATLEELPMHTQVDIW